MNDTSSFAMAPIRSACALFMSAALLAAGAPALAQTQCERSAMRGQWTGALDGDYTCNFAIRNNGRFSGTCVEDRGDTYNVEGNFTLRSDCRLRARIDFIGEPEIYAGEGRVWGTSSDRPEAGLVVSTTPRRFFDLHLYRTR